MGNGYPLALTPGPSPNRRREHAIRYIRYLHPLLIRCPSAATR
ncbi:MAG: hypothetical protein NZM11_03540 [Anaerolineales bacterium]|nr:hypothetical protein [Anaerolineales bacterium]